jgi:surface antigen
MNVAQFISAYLGVGNVGENPVNRGQCVGLVEVWLTANKKPHIAGNAKDLLANADLKDYKTFHNGPTNLPPPGAIVCWDGSWGAGYGHTAVVIAANANRLAVLEQNDPTGAPCVVATHGYQGVLGWITW